MEAKEYIEIIEGHLSSNDPHRLIYAALDCRLAIEKFVHDRLTFHSTRLSAQLLFKKWQPNIAMGILTQLEPDADKTFGMHIKREEPGAEFYHLGTHQGIDQKWLRKKYNSLGAYVHLNDSADIEKIKRIINECLVELRRLTSSKFETNLAMVVQVECPRCKGNIIVNEKAIPTLKEVWCPAPKCETRFDIELDEDDDTKFYPIDSGMVDFKCNQCEENIPLDKNKLKIDYEFDCPKCSSKYRICQQHQRWDVLLVTEAEPLSPPPPQP